MSIAARALFPRMRTYAALRRLGPYLRPYWIALVGSGGVALAADLIGLVIPIVIREVVDGPVAHGQSQLLPLLSLGVLAIGMTEAGLLLLRRRLIVGPVTRIEAVMRTEIYARLQRLPLSFHDTWASGQLLSRISSDTLVIRSFLAFSGIYVVVHTVTIAVGGVLLTWLVPWQGLVVWLTAVPLVLLCRYLERRYALLARQAQDQAGDLVTMAEESTLGIRVLKSLGRGGRQAAAFVAAASELRGTELLKIRLLAMLWGLIIVLPEAAMALIVGLGTFGVVKGDITIGTLIASVMVMTYLYWPIASIGWLLTEANDAAAATARYFEVCDTQPAIADPRRPVELPAPVRGELKLADVRFRYPRAGSEVLTGVNLTLEPGETVALVGATGSGKTTLATLVPRLRDVTGGVITLDGIDIRELRLADLRRAVAIAFDDPVLISASVRENVTLGYPDASEHETWDALRTAHADGFVAELPNGLETAIGEQGFSLSGGQRQRLALARAVLVRPPVLVLDDPLSALDVHTEADVERALRSVLSETTALIVAHRPSTVRLADRVALLAEGCIAAVGQHDDMLRRCAAYRTLMSGEVPSVACLDEVTVK